MLIIFNNKFISEKQAKISFLSKSFMYGYGVFETLRTYEKKPFKVIEHINRLFESAKFIDLKVNHTKKEITEMILKISKKSEYKNQKIKIILIEEGIIITSEKLSIDQKLYEGIKCMSFSCQRSMPQIKSISYLSSYLSHKKAIDKEYFEAILLNYKEEVLEGAYSNIFWFENNTLCTRKNDVLKGITAKTVIELSPYKIKYKNIKLKELLNKKEIFLTQTTTGIVPVIQIDGKKINNRKIGSGTKKIMNLYETLTKRF